MRRWLSLLLVTFVLAAAFPLIGCGDKEPKEAYKVGAVFAVTGANGPLGTPEKQTVEMMVAQINASGGVNGHPLEVIIYDTQSDATTCVTLVNRLILQDNVLAIIGPSSTGESMALIDTITAAEISLVSCAAGITIVTPVAERKWVFKTPQSDVFAAQNLCQYIKGLGMTKIAIITDNLGFGAGGKAVLVAQAPNYGLTIVADPQFDNNDSDMSPYITQIASTSAQAVICWGTNPGPANVAKAMAAQNVTLPLFSSHGIANKKFIELGGTAVNGVIFTAGKLLVASQLSADDPQKTVLTQYLADFEAKYGAGTANPFGGYAYDALKLVVMALEKAGPDKAKVRDEIEKITNYAGVTGIFDVSAQDHMGLTSDSFVLIKIVNGQWTWLH